ncbi:hypothetical protein Tco_1580270, partial [Tanacetum coccineum]
RDFEGLTIIVCDLTVIDMDEFARLHIYKRIGDIWAWVAPGLERQQVDAARDAQVDLGVAEEGALDVSTPMQPPPGPQASAPAPRTMPQRMARLEEEVYRLPESLGEQHADLDEMS